MQPPSVSRLSYGSLTFRNDVFRVLRHAKIDSETRALLAEIFLILFYLSVGLCFFIGWRSTQLKQTIGRFSENERLLFLAFAAIFTGTFLLGSNWNYRLIFLIPLIPGFFPRLFSPETGKQANWSNAHRAYFIKFLFAFLSV